MSCPPTRAFAFRVDDSHAGQRLDSLVAAQVDQCSRSFAASLIRQGAVTIDGFPQKPSCLVKAGQLVRGTITAPTTPRFAAQAIPLQILYEDADLVAVNKAPGMVVHPAPGHSRDTLANALMHHCPDLSGIGGSLRPGIVHRLDKDTSGVMVVAKTDLAMRHLAGQFKSRLVRKHYLALVYGVLQADRGSIDRPIGRHPRDRKKMSVITHSPKGALTYWRVKERLAGATLLELDIRTGRTHQIRVHCLNMGHPVIGDPVYRQRGATRQMAAAAPGLAGVVGPIGRQMLHAWKLRISHPASGEPLLLEAPLPADMAGLLEQFRSSPLP
jgi:23S rRNA pseudouridine1911/1915/1917 synthase